MRTFNLVLAASLVAFSSSALAESPASSPAAPTANQSFPEGFVDYMTVGNRAEQSLLGGGPSNIVWINRCIGGCDITLVGANQDDAQNNETSIRDRNEPLPIGTVVEVPEFQYSQETYDEVIACLQDVWRPYDVQIVTEEPAPGVIHHEAILAGTATDIGYRENVNGGRILGVAPSICTVRDNVISFSFANAHPDNPTQLCWTLSHEIGHSFGLEHMFKCEDPMTYLVECGFDKFFRDQGYPCGTAEASSCFCGVQEQNTHQWLLSVFGEGQGAAAPAVSILSPDPDEVVGDRYPILTNASDVRGVEYVEFYINGRLVQTVEENNGGANGYVYVTPRSQSDGVQNIEIRAFNDLGLMTTATVTAVKGTVCATNDDCAADEACESGACEVLPPSVEVGEECISNAQCFSGLCVASSQGSLCSEECTITGGECGDGFACRAVSDNEGVCWPEALLAENGEECTANDECLSGECTDSSEGARCTVSCVPGLEGACADGFQCLATTGAEGVCWPSGGGGGCSVSDETSGSGSAVWLLGLALLALPRRRRR